MKQDFIEERLYDVSAYSATFFTPRLLSRMGSDNISRSLSVISEPISAGSRHTHRSVAKPMFDSEA